MARRTKTVTFNLDGPAVDAGNSNGGIADQNSGDGDSGSGAGTGTGTVIDPVSIAGPADANGSDNSGGRKPRSDRGKKRGPRSAKEDKIDLNVFSETVSEIHSMMAFFTGVPEWALDEKTEEHIKLGRAVSRVARHYNLPSIDPVKYDWFMLFKTAAIIYGSKWMHYHERKRAEKARDVTSGPVQGSVPTAPAAKNAAPQKPNGAMPPQPPKSGPGIAHVTIPGFENIGPVKIPLN